MDYLWAPWRMDFIENPKKSYECIFCIKIKENRDKENLILYRSTYSFVIMNLYPYNNGHLMIAPYRHIKDLEILSEEESKDIFFLIIKSLKVLKKTLNPAGFNIGMNMGKCAGAGIEEHIHIHIVPRWEGDTNFMPVISHTRVMPELLITTFSKLLSNWEKDA